MADVFISYSSKDERIANEMCTAFEKEGLSCWIAPRNIQVGKEYGGEIIKGIEGCKVFFLCLSKDANESQHVLREVERAVNRKLPIIVYQHEETVLCIAENVVAFFPYDGAESGMRAQDGDVYFNQEKLSDYTDEQLVNFWGSSDWETANIRSWCLKIHLYLLRA